jgi:hypothetical protein
MAKTKAPRNTLALTLQFKGAGTTTEIEIHTLNPGEAFPNFGKFKYAAVAGETASIITRTKNVDTSDLEMDIYDKNFWAWIGRVIARDGLKDVEITVKTPE